MAYDQRFRDEVVDYAIATNITNAGRKYNVNEKTVRHWKWKRERALEAQDGHSATALPGQERKATFEGKYSDRFSQKKEGVCIAVIPDVQAKPGVDTEHLSFVGRYIAEKRPDIIVNIGDFADMPSLSFHDEPGSKNFEGARYREDLIATHNAMKALMEPIQKAMKTGWKPRLVLTLGNHENRIDRTIESTPKLDGTMGMPDLEYERWGWEVYPFLQPVIIEGIAFCHYFCSGVMGRPITTARQLLIKKHMSCFAGHQQGRDIAYGYRGDGTEMTAIICGSCYEHDENYLNHQTNRHFRGIYFLHDVVDGTFEEMPISLKYLRRRYGG